MFIIFHFIHHHHAVDNAWDHNAGGLIEKINSVAMPVLKDFFMPSAGIERAKAWQGTTAASYSFTFQLLNTISLNALRNNRILIQTLVNNNLMNRRDAIGIDPPVLYEITVPGIRTCPAAVISNLRIENIGQMNNIDSRNVPDAYEITITIQELLIESRQIYQQVFLPGAKVVSAITNTAESESALAAKDIGEKTKEGLTTTGKALGIL